MINYTNIEDIARVFSKQLFASFFRRKTQRMQTKEILSYTIVH